MILIRVFRNCLIRISVDCLPQMRSRVAWLGRGLRGVVRLGVLLRSAPGAGLVAVLMAGCASWPGSVSIGSDRAEILRRLGPPAVERAVVSPKESGSSEWLYPTGPIGQETFALRLDASGKLRAIEQVLGLENFARAQMDTWQREDLLQAFGPPSEIRELGANRIWWSYRYREHGVWNSLYTFEIDGTGRVRSAINGPDPLFEVDDPWPLSRLFPGWPGHSFQLMGSPFGLHSWPVAGRR